METFLKERGISEETISSMIENKIDETVVPLLSDEQLKEFIPKYGDRIALNVFCRRNPERSSEKRKQELIRELSNMNNLTSKRNRTHDVRSKSMKGNQNAKKRTRRVETGWYNHNRASNQYKQVKSPKGGGVRHLKCDETSTVADILRDCKELFFIDGFSSMGNVSEFDCHLGDIRQEKLDLTLTVAELYSRYKVKMLRLYLMTKRKDTQVTISSEEDNTSPKSDIDPLLYTAAGTPTVLFRNDNERSSSLVNEYDTNREQNTLPDLDDLMEIFPSVSGENNDTQSEDDELPDIDHILSTTTLQQTEDVSIEDLRRRRLAFFDDEPARINEDVTQEDEHGDAEVTEQGQQQLSHQQNQQGTNEQRSCQSFDGTREPDPIPVEEIDVQDIPSPKTLENILKSWIAKTKEENNEPNLIMVKRGKLLKATLRIFQRKTFRPEDPFKVVFSNEDADDQGGPKREYLQQLMKELEEDILEGPDGNKFFRHDIERLVQEKYEAAGKLVAFSILHGGCGFSVLNKNVYNLMTGQPMQNPTIEELSSDEETKAKLLAIKNASTIQEIDVNWCIDKGLNPSGITIETKQQVLENLLKNEMFYRVHYEITQFTRGLDSVGGLFKTILSAPKQLQSLFVHQNAPLTFAMFRKLYKLELSEKGSNKREKEEEVIYCLEAFLVDCEAGNTEVSLGDFLSFWTGSNRVPPLGFGQPLIVSFIQTQDHRLPVAHTCGLVLELWRGYNDPDVFRDEMTRAITWSGGFHLA